MEFEEHGKDINIIHKIAEKKNKEIVLILHSSLSRNKFHKACLDDEGRKYKKYVRNKAYDYYSTYKNMVLRNYS